MVTSPHQLASESGVRVLREGGNAIEATIAMAATLAVVYPHMTSIGGDGFWLICPPGQAPLGIDVAVARPRLRASVNSKSVLHNATRSATFTNQSPPG